MFTVEITEFLRLCFIRANEKLRKKEGSRAHQLDEAQKCLLVLRPLALQLRGGRVLATGELERDLHAVAVQVVEVLHAACAMSRKR